MDTTTSVVTTGIVVCVGEWSKPDGKISMKLVVGVMTLTVFLAGLQSANADLASKLAFCILMTAMFNYAIPITSKLGFSK